MLLPMVLYRPKYGGVKGCVEFVKASNSKPSGVLVGTGSGGVRIPATKTGWRVPCIVTYRSCSFMCHCVMKQQPDNVHSSTGPLEGAVLIVLSLSNLRVLNRSIAFHTVLALIIGSS